jgi:hypothetical protein
MAGWATDRGGVATAVLVVATTVLVVATTDLVVATTVPMIATPGVATPQRRGRCCVTTAVVATPARAPRKGQFRRPDLLIAVRQST